MRPEVAKGYLSTAREIARHLAGPSVDVLAFDRDDYASEMALKAVTAWRAHGFKYGFGASSERPYVLRAMWHQGRDLRDKRQANIRSLPVLSLNHEICGEAEEGRLEAREQLRLLDQNLDGTTRELLDAAGSGRWGRAYAQERGVHHQAISVAREKVSTIFRTM